jgi:lysophospholipase L1-like esterase
LPDAVIFMFAPLVSRGGYNTHASFTAVRDAKQAAAARYPRNVVFIDNMAEEWVSGSGRVGATAGDGNADWVRGTDGTHPALAGAEFFAHRIVRAIAAALPQLAGEA